jgi:glycerophosphoryl diester phosphodiesterase
VVAAAYAALWIVRCSLHVVPVPARRVLTGGPLVIAHRGASRAAQEHSFAAYRRALADGADVLELDVQLSRDRAIVVSHDPSLERALGVPLAIGEHDLAELRAALATRQLGASPTSLLPTLDDVMDGFPRVRLNVELKTDSAALADAVAAAIERRHRTDDVLVASFHGDALERFRAASHGRVATSASTAEAARFYVCYLLDVPCRPAYEALQIPPRLRRSWPRFHLDTPEFIRFAHRHGLAVHYWTIDDPAQMAHLLAAGADGIMTNDPARAVSVRAAPARR